MVYTILDSATVLKSSKLPLVQEADQITIEQPTATASGTDTYTATIEGIESYETGLIVGILFTNGNTGSSTLNINSLGAKTLKKSVSTNLAASDIAAGQALLLYYDGTNFQVIGLGGGGSGSGTVNSGTQYRLAYYATTGTAVSEAGAITASRILKSDSNGVPTHTSFADSDVVIITGNQTIGGVKTFSSDPLIPDEAYGSGWNGVLEPPTKNAVYDKIESIISSTNRVLLYSSVTASSTTGGTSDVILDSFLVTGGTLQDGDILQFSITCTKSGTAGQYTISVSTNTTSSLSGATRFAYTVSANTQLWAKTSRDIIIVTAASSQIMINEGVSNFDDKQGLASAKTTRTEDFSTDKYFIISVNPASAADTITLESSRFEIIR